MKDAAAKIADDWIRNDTERNERAIRSAIRRAVKAERERCVGIITPERERYFLDNTIRVAPYLVCDKIIEKINTPATKRPSRRK